MNQIYHPYILAFVLLIGGCSVSNDTSLQWIESPAAENSQLPFLSADKSGNVFMSWVEPAGEKEVIKLLYSQFKEDGWSEPQPIDSSSGWFVNWADYPSVLAQNGSVKAAHVLKKIPGNTYSYNVNVYLNKADKSWSAPITPHFDSTATEHGFVSMTPWNDTILAIWLDGRRSQNRSEEEYYDMDKAMTLRSTVIDQKGTITQQHLIDATVCDCCNTSIATTSKGAIAAYRNRTSEEIRDIYVSRFTDGKWSTPTPVHNDNWKIGACPVNGPAVAAYDSVAVVAWYTAAGGNPTVKVAFSTDYGKTFSKPVVINEANALGRVDAVINKKGKAFISWLEQREGVAQLKVKALSVGTGLSSSIDITEINSSRKSGFPQMALAGNRLLFAWTEVDSTTTVKTAVLPVSFFN